LRIFYGRIGVERREMGMDGKVKVIGMTVVATEDALAKACPARPKWAAGVVSNLGVEIALESPKLRKIALCPEVLELAGYQLKVVAADEFEKVVKTIEEEKG